ncbi:NAD(P)-dependent oxidoreductase [candidate division KSB1 bacterium]|nr:NAD(P)-dependent oxidoreductase [candidate division KSB1 bacterium]NIV70788.1 NAD-dependent epimerase/dehydratase family protein [Phycisphaerae bacterium]NIR72906.1 NAD(P)-dependent oxidoreductase [candidate division KSB1 bacterium]NIT73704.1 NAD(P)-dependent oxidoreductase [candidate division KSB1 bacterium]NIU27576.1 NAD(P)-dependent oxidoreductase [candidate division KSB1 bacterium]
MRNVHELDQFMTTPNGPLIEMMKRIPGDFLILGAGGKMGVSLATLAKRSAEEAGAKKKVVAVSRFSDAAALEQLTWAGVETISCDLMNESNVLNLPDAENVVYMVGMKFGSTNREAETWAVNAYLPGLIARRFRRARFAVFSSGNVYPLTSVESGGCREKEPVGPIGEYAQSVLGRERIFEYFSQKYQIPCSIIRLNYAIDLRYGVLHDVAQKVFARKPLSLAMGYVNVIWQGDANSMALRSLEFAKAPPFILNVTGLEIVSIRKLAERFGELFKITPVFEGTEAETALLSDATLCSDLFGVPSVRLEEMIRWTAFWVQEGLPDLAKPTHFETRDGKF